MADLNIVTADVNELDKQKSYVAGLVAQGFDHGFAVGSAFVESMRNTYYNHTGTALDELIDNAIEAGARQVHLTLGYYGKSDAKPDAIAIIDNGHGMIAEMIRLAVLWGGTHREGSRTSFGRFGFGLPTASVNQARRFSVFSITDDGAWNGITVDLDDIREGKYNNEHGRVIAPPVTAAQPPKWVLDYIKGNFKTGRFTHGTVVLWEKLDRIKWKTRTAMAKNILEHFGLTYRNYLDKVDLFFDGTKVAPTDPLFITPGFRYFDVDEDRAVPLPPAKFEVKSSRTGEKVGVTVRFARFPGSFFGVDKAKKAGVGNQNPRFSVANSNRGIIVCRQGRQLDTIESTPWKGFEKFRNNDRYWAAEIDFPAELDEEFTVSNNKQRVVMTDRFWDLLDDAGVQHALRALRKAYEDEAEKDAAEEGRETTRLAELAMHESEKFRRKRPGTNPVERQKAAKEALEQYVKRTARESKRSEEDVRQQFDQDTADHPYRVEFEYMPGAPFFRTEQLGGQKVLRLNRAHGFYSALYAAPGSTRGVRAGLEVLLFSIGECELDSAGNPDKSHFYKVERAAWSDVLESGLEVLSRFVHQTTVADIDDGEKQAEAAE